MARPGHMAGIDNAVPRWDRSNPTTYTYDPTNYNAADYAQFKQAQLDAQAEHQKATAKRSKEVMKEVNRAIKEKMKLQSTDKEGVDRSQVEAWAKAGHTLWADIPSSCFESLSFEPDPDDPTTGTLVGTFWRGGAGTYEGPGDLDDFLDAVEGGSLGGWYNDTQPF